MTRRKPRIRVVRGGSRYEAYSEWGALDVRQRAFQMDLTRRLAAGRMASWFGPSGLEHDRGQRFLGLYRTAELAVELLPAAQRACLAAYCAGARTAIPRGRPASLGHALVRRRMAPWTEVDSLLVLLYLYQGLAYDIAGRRAAMVMRSTMPGPVADFLMPDDDLDELSLGALAALGSPACNEEPARAPHHGVSGSNCCTVPIERSATGAPILACDLHLPQTVPNALRRIELSALGMRVSGVSVPGLPIVVAGSNGHIAWGVTNLPGDTLELVPLDRTTGVLSSRVERIEVRGRATEQLSVQETREGPILEQAVAGQRVAVCWSGSWPMSIDLGMSELAWCTNIDDALQSARSAGGMPLNLHVAQCDGRTAHTVAGRIPFRRDGRLHRDCYLEPSEIPVREGTRSTALVSANDCGAPVAGWNHPPAWRSQRLLSLLASREDWTERSAFGILLDVRAQWLERYRALALRVLPVTDEESGAISAAISDWDGTLEPWCTGAPLLADFRKALTAELLAPLLAPCVAADREFSYAWRNSDPVVWALVRGGDPQRLPRRPGETLDERIAVLLREVAARLAADHRRPASRVRWGEAAGGRRARSGFEQTPLAAVFRSLPLPARGEDDCLCAAGEEIGPTMRMAVSPGRERAGLIAMIGGQDESPLSFGRTDHHHLWLRGEAASLREPVA